MKKFLITCTMLSAFVSLAAKAGSSHLCLLPDAVCVPSAGQGWDAVYHPAADIIVQMTATGSVKGEYMSPRITIKKEPRCDTAEAKDGNANERKRYSYVDHYLPVEGMLIKRDDDNFTYKVDCVRQHSDARSDEDLEDWCSGYADEVVWPDERKFEPDTGDVIERWSRLAFDGPGIAAQYERFKGADKPDVLSESVLDDYVGLLITEDLYSPGRRSAASTKDGLGMVATRLAGPRSAQVKELIAIHEDYLAGKYNSVEDRIGGFIKHYSDVPYWLMSVWMQPINEEVAQSFAMRAMKGYPSQVSAFTQAECLSRKGDYAGSDRQLLDARVKNVNAMVLMAQNAIDQGKTREAEKFLNKAAGMSRDDVQFFFTQAEFINQQKGEGYYEKARSLYRKLEDMPALNDAGRTRLYRGLAGMEFDPERKIDYYHKILALNKGKVEIYYELGKLYLLEKHDVKEALKNFKQYLKLAADKDPRLQELRDLVSKLELESG